jgi:formylmethanofuran:tetrahydromethanopterin formyltransferase
MAAEWNKLVSTEATLTRLVTAGMMTEAAIGGWMTSAGENYPDPRPGEIVVFEDFYWRGFGNPCHPFL